MKILIYLIFFQFIRMISFPVIGNSSLGYYAVEIQIGNPK